MDFVVLKKVIDYVDVYELISHGVVSVEELKTLLRENGAAGGTMKRRSDYVCGDPAYLSINGDCIIYDYVSMARDLNELRSRLIPVRYDIDRVKQLEEELDDAKMQIEELNSTIQDYSQENAELRKQICELNSKLSKKENITVKDELDRKVLVASSITVGPKEHNTDSIFLSDPEELLDVDKCVARYGGELDSFYDEIPDDEENTGFEPGHELTQKNYALSIMKVIGTKRFFEKRIRDNREAKKIESRVGQLFPGHDDKKSERQKERDRILRNRFTSLNNIIKCDSLSNQEKLMMYAMNSEYHNTHVERLLNYAAQHCINANFLIDILEDPNVCTTYENTVEFLNQFAQPSEFRMKLDLARELIEGKWYITADYNGRKTKFQLVPIDEFNELRKAAGLPVSRFTYKEEDITSTDTQKEEEAPKKPDFVENAVAVQSTRVDIPDDGFMAVHETDENDYPDWGDKK